MSSPPAASVAAIVLELIAAKGLSVNKAAELSRVPRQTLERKLDGVGAFTVPELTRIAQALDTTGSALLALAEAESAAA